MSSGFEKPITVREAINAIDNRTYLLPAIQRKYVWSSEQVEALFDSLLQEYPINSFMFWDVRDQELKTQLKFYQFLQNYRERYRESNDYFQTTGHKDFVAVIDGQQRLTSLYIGLKGTYAYKVPKKWWNDDEETIPTRRLYVDLSNSLPDESEERMRYNFKFLTDSELQTSREDKTLDWFQVMTILTLQSRDELDEYIDQHGYGNQKFSKEVLRKLWDAVNERPAINFYLEKKQDLSTVLDIFLRTNSGGEPLKFADLLMSITTASWEKLDARKEFTETIEQVSSMGRPGFIIDTDWILKSCLVLLQENIRFKVRNFDHTSVIELENDWPDIRTAIEQTFKLMASFGFSQQTLPSKNAVIPIVYFIYHTGISAEINNPIRFKAEKVAIKKWLIISLLKGVFGGQSDTVLSKIRGILSDYIQSQQASSKGKVEGFPLAQIKEAFRTDPSRNLGFDDDFLDGLLHTRKDDPAAFSVLALLYPQLDYSQVLHKDHLHPADFFKKIAENKALIPPDDYPFYNDPKNWDSILNLQLLNDHVNTSKQDKPLREWLAQGGIDLDAQIIPTNVDLDISHFRAFINARRELLKARLKQPIV